MEMNLYIWAKLYVFLKVFMSKKGSHVSDIQQT